MDFNQAKLILDDAGINYSVDYEYRGKGKERQPHDIPIFTSVELKFDAQTWFLLCNCDGDHYVGGCCRQTSVIQDRINSILRSSASYIDVRDLEWFAGMWKIHDGDSSYFSEEGWKKEFGECPGSDPRLDETRYIGLREPWTHIAWLWHVVKDNYEPRMAYVSSKHISEIEEAVSILHRTLLNISWEHIVDRDKEKTSQQNSNRVIALARMMPALETFNKRFNELDPGPIEGFALVDPKLFSEDDKEKSIPRNGYGLCIYGSKEEAENLLASWNKKDKEMKEERNKKLAPDYEIKPVRVSSDKGIEWLEN